MTKRTFWQGAVLGVFTVIIGCAAQTPKHAVISGAEKKTEPVVREGALPKGGYMTKEGLILSKDGIDFANHPCLGSYSGKTSDRTANDQDRLTGYKLTTICTSNGEQHATIYSKITYNVLNQRTGYHIQLSCSRTGKEYEIEVSNLSYDRYSEPLSYTAVINGRKYDFVRQ